MTHRTLDELKVFAASTKDRPTQTEWNDVFESVYSGTVLVQASGSDDSANILRARDAAGLTGGRVKLGPGSFTASEFLGFPDDTGFVGSGPGTLLTFTSAIDIGIGNIDGASGNSRLFVGDMRIDGNDLCNDPIEWNNVTDGIISRVWVTQGNHDCIELQSCQGCTIDTAILTEANTFNGLELDDSVDCTAIGVIAYNNAQDGISIEGTSTKNSIMSCHSRDNTRGGFLASANTVRNLVHGWADGNSPNYSDSGTNNLFPIDGSDRFDFSVGGTLSARIRTGEVYLSARDAVPTDGNTPTSMLVFYLDETGNSLKVKAKYANGTTVRIGTVALI